MSKNFLVYFVLCILFQLLVEVNCQMSPRVLSGHTATLIDKKLYIVGGLGAEREFFYLDVSVPFDTQKLLWKDLSNINIVPPHAGAASVKGGADNSTLPYKKGMSGKCYRKCPENVRVYLSMSGK